MRGRSVVLSLLLVLAAAGAARAGSIPTVCRAPRSTASPADCDVLTVFVRLTFDPSIDEKSIRRIAEAETSDIWRRYDVDIVWSDTEQSDRFALDAFVTSRNDLGSANAAAALGHAVVGQATVMNGPAAGPIRVSLDAIETLIGEWNDRPSKLRDDALAMALGRVLAHEIGHVLLGRPSYHDPHGLMRPTFHSAEMVRPDRSGFGLSDRSIARLRERIRELKSEDVSAKGF